MTFRTKVLVGMATAAVVGCTAVHMISGNHSAQSVIIGDDIPAILGAVPTHQVAGSNAVPPGQIIGIFEPQGNFHSVRTRIPGGTGSFGVWGAIGPRGTLGVDPNIFDSGRNSFRVQDGPPSISDPVRDWFARYDGIGDHPPPVDLAGDERMSMKVRWDREGQSLPVPQGTLELGLQDALDNTASLVIPNAYGPVETEGEWVRVEFLLSDFTDDQPTPVDLTQIKHVVVNLFCSNIDTDIERFRQNVDTWERLREPGGHNVTQARIQGAPIHEQSS